MMATKQWQPMRLDRFICKSTQLTKDEAIAAIQSGEVFVNGMAVLAPALQVHENNHIEHHGERLIARASRYLLMHKPINTICSNIDEAYPSLFNYIDIQNASELHIAGRLDADTTGLVLITDDGRWSFGITNPKQECRKVYRVTLRSELSKASTQALIEGVLLQGESKPTLPAELTRISDNEVLLTITEGRFHQVKRMFAAVGNRVITLHREKIGSVSLDVDEGKWRFLTPEEIASFTYLSLNIS